MPRFLLPILPCLALLIGSAAARLGKGEIVPRLALLFALGQFILVHGQALGVLAPRPSITGHLWPIHRDKTSVALLDEIVTRTCIERDNASPTINLLAVAPELKGDWLAPAPASYAVAKRFGRRTPCLYAYAGSSFLGADLESTWQEVLRLQPRYLITNDPAVYPSPKTSINRSMGLDNHLALVDRFQEGGLYKLETRLRADPGFVIFRRHE